MNADQFFFAAQEGDTVTVVRPGRQTLYGVVYSIDSRRISACLDNYPDACPYALMLELDRRHGSKFTIHPRVGGAL